MKTVKKINLDILPESYDEFVKEAAEKLYEPESCASLFICALKIFMENQEEGIKCLNLITYNKQNSPVMYFPRLQQILAKQPYLPDSYFSGASAENGYIPDETKTVTVKTDNEKGIRKDLKTVYIGCNGSGNFRPITLIKIPEEKADLFCKELKSENDMWFVNDYISILLDVKPIAY